MNRPDSAESFELERRSGRVPIVVYAPHGGRRARAVRRGDSVNDLHTADIANELACRLDAFALVNRTLDRNVADLNRISALAGRASPVLAALREVVEAAGVGGIAPLVLLVHGWNVTLPACDVGIGLVERDGSLYGAYATVSRATLDGFVRELRSALAADGIEAPIGRRYPASGKDNATQLFSGRHRQHDASDAAALSMLASAGGVDAVQLELAIPLRWPGPHREAFLAAVTSAAKREGERRARERDTVRSARSEWGLPSPPPASRESRIAPGWSTQAVLPDGGGLFAGAEPTGPHDAAARLCLVRPDGRMFLFVGEGAWSGDPARYTIGGFTLEARDDGAPGLSLSHRGPMVIYPTHDAFCDLELGLAGAHVVDADVRLSLDASGGSFGRLYGHVHAAAERLEIDATAVWERGGRRSGAGVRSRVFVTSGPLAPAVDDACAWRTGADGEVCGIEMHVDEQALVARVLTRIPVYRVVANDVVVKVTFGTASLDAHDAPGSAGALALFERVEIVTTA